jgi:hypothetical protein
MPKAPRPAPPEPGLDRWLHGRCGKRDLAGGKPPSKEFGANAVWRWIACAHQA